MTGIAILVSPEQGRIVTITAEGTCWVSARLMPLSSKIPPTSSSSYRLINHLFDAAREVQVKAVPGLDRSRHQPLGTSRTISAKQCLTTTPSANLAPKDSSTWGLELAGNIITTHIWPSPPEHKFAHLQQALRHIRILAQYTIQSNAAPLSSSRQKSPPTSVQVHPCNP